jgi:tRNA A37 threonylcarbamoyladenosine modification protein TsaB
MYYLIFSNNSSNIFFSIYQDKKLLLTNIYLQTKNTSEDVFKIIEDMFNSLNLHFNIISFIGLTNGPSSFTNSRVLVALANAISLSLNIPTISFSNFYFYLQIVLYNKIEFENLAITIDSKRKNGVYLCLFNNSNLENKEGFFCDIAELTKINNNTQNIIFYGDKPNISLDESFYHKFNYIDNIEQDNGVLASLCLKEYHILLSKNQHKQALFSNVYYI